MRHLLAILALTTFLTAQPPASWDGWVACSSFRVNGLPNPTTPFTGSGGVWMLHPRLASQTPLQLTGLPASITGAGSTAERIGANSIAWLPPSPLLPEGGLVLGEISPIGSTVNIHIAALAGTAATVLTTAVGTAAGNGAATPFGSIDQMAVVPDPAAAGLNHRVIFTARGITGNGFSASGGPVIGILTDYAPYIFALTSASTVPGAINALCVNAAGTTAYYAVINAPANGQSQIYSVDLPTTLPTGIALLPQLVATVPHYVLSLATRNDGSLLAGLLASSGTPGAQNYAVVTLPGGGVNYLTAGNHARNAVAIEQFTGTTFAQRESYGPNVMEVMHRSPSGTEVLLSAGPSGGWGVISGIAVMKNPVQLSQAAVFNDPANFQIQWDLAHATAGTYVLPRLDTASFNLAIVGSGSFPADGIGFAWMDLSLPLGAATNTGPPFNLSMTVDPFSAELWFPFFTLTASAPRSTMALPIPATPTSLIGLKVALQFAYYSATAGPAATQVLWMGAPLRITVLQ